MKLFISYGHDCTELIEKVKEDLEHRGHEVWLDHDALNAGLNWRKEIADAIVQCQAVLVFMSSHSLRFESVCNDEISIAVACNRRGIRTILLEEERKQSIPPIINGIMYHEWFDWKNRFRDDAWYSERFAALVSDIENLPDDSYREQMDALHTILRPNLLTGKLLREQNKPYSARQWLDIRIKKWLEEQGNEPLIMLGFPGSGKTRYCVNYCQLNPNVISLISCEWSGSGEFDTGMTIRNIAYQIAARLPAYRNRLLWLLNSQPVGLTNRSASELFDILIVEPFLYVIDGNASRLLIVIDSMDEATCDNDNSLAMLISQKAHLLPHFVHFLITTRRDTAVLRCYSGANVLEIRPNDRKVRADIKLYLKTQLADSAAREVGRSLCDVPIDKITDACGGSFLLASLITDGIRQGVIARDGDQLIPRSVYSMYFEWMRRIVPGSVFETQYYNAFSMLAALKKPAPLSLFRTALKWNAGKTASFLRRFKSFLLEEKDCFGNSCLALYHRSFAEWLADEDGAADVYCISVEEGRKLLAEAACGNYRANVCTESELSQLWDLANDAQSAELIAGLTEDDAFLDRLIKLAAACIKRRELFSAAQAILKQCAEICGRRRPGAFTDHAKNVEIPLIRASAYFESGDHYAVESILSERIADIETIGTAEERMNALFLIGVSSDLLGKRQQSVVYFEKLNSIATEENNIVFRRRALIGLAWNGHFTNVDKMVDMMESLQKVEAEDDRDDAEFKLVTARAMLSKGQLESALAIYEEVLDCADPDIWGYSNLAIRNQMLLIESLVACFDNEKYDQGTVCGQRIFEHLCKMGSVAECYCLSWIAMNYLMNGKPNKAEIFLLQAERINREANSTPHSKWIVMHLCSVRAFLHAETGEYEQAAEKHMEVIRMARECDDPWVLGDACFNVLLLNRIAETGDRDTIEKIRTELADTARSAQLPHLLFKSELANAVYSDEPTREMLEPLAGKAMSAKLPSTDMVVCGYLCWLIARKIGDGDMQLRLKTAVRDRITAIELKNPNGAYAARRMIGMITEEIEK